MTDTRPYCLPKGERFLTQKLLLSKKASIDQKLDLMSRINFKKVYTIEYDVKVMNVGLVAGDSLPVLIAYGRQSKS
jgi:hypothetical protein